jgi:hypothetical protein
VLWSSVNGTRSTPEAGNAPNCPSRVRFETGGLGRVSAGHMRRSLQSQLDSDPLGLVAGEEMPPRRAA